MKSAIYNKNVKKALKGETIICRVEGSAVYVCNAYLVYKMLPEEYAEYVQPVTCCEAGNYRIDSAGKRDLADGEMDLPKLFSDAVNAAQAETQRAPFEFAPKTTRGAPFCGFYSAVLDVCSFYNVEFFAGLNLENMSFCIKSALSPLIAYFGSEPVAMILPVRVTDPAPARAVKSYFIDSTVDRSAEIAQLEKQIEAERAEAQELRARLSEMAHRLQNIDSDIPFPDDSDAPQGAPTAEDRRAALERLNAQQNADNAFYNITSADVEAEAQRAAEEEPAQEPAAGYTLNPDKDGIEITFQEKPSAETREMLKAAGFRWSNARRVWYARQSAERLELAQKIAQENEILADVPAEAPASALLPIRFYWNGLKVGDGLLIKCFYGIYDGEVTITAKDYKDLPRDYFTVVNNSDVYTDYFDDDRTTLDAAHPLYKFALYAALKARARGTEKRVAYLEKSIAEPEKWNGQRAAYQRELDGIRANIAEYNAAADPGQPTAADLRAVEAMKHAEESARIAAEHEEELQRREELLRLRCDGRRLIEETAAAYPVSDDVPTVTIQWSEHPAFYSWGDGALVLSLPAAEIILHKLDDEQHEREGGYYKTSFLLRWNDGETYEGRYDLGDGDNGLIEHIRSFGKWNAENAKTDEGREEGRQIVELADWLQGFCAVVTVPDYAKDLIDEWKNRRGEA